MEQQVFNALIQQVVAAVEKGMGCQIAEILSLKERVGAAEETTDDQLKSLIIGEVKKYMGPNFRISYMIEAEKFIRGGVAAGLGERKLDFSLKGMILREKVKRREKALEKDITALMEGGKFTSSFSLITPFRFSTGLCLPIHSSPFNPSHLATNALNPLISSFLAQT